MKICMRCTYIAIMAASLTALEAHAQVVTAPKVTTPVAQPPATAPEPYAVQFSVQLDGAAPPAQVGSFRAISVEEVTFNYPQTPSTRAYQVLQVIVTRRPDGYSTLFKQMVNRVMVGIPASTLTTQKDGDPFRTLWNLRSLTKMTDAVDRMQPVETLTFQFTTKRAF